MKFADAAGGGARRNAQCGTACLPKSQTRWTRKLLQGENGDAPVFTPSADYFLLPNVKNAIVRWVGGEATRRAETPTKQQTQHKKRPDLPQHDKEVFTPSAQIPVQQNRDQYVIYHKSECDWFILNTVTARGVCTIVQTTLFQWLIFTSPLKDFVKMKWGCTGCSSH